MLYTRDQVTITSTNLSPVVSICSIVCLCLSTLSVAGRVFTKAAVVRRLAVDDFTVISATVLSIGQTAAVLSASAHGLGKPWNKLGGSDRNAFEKALYVSSLLFILTTILVKISIILFLRALAPIAALRKTGDTLVAVFLTWGLGSFLAAAFQCSVPHVWQRNSSTCLNIRAFDIAFDAINILTEFALIIWPTAIIVRLHASKKRRTAFIAAFAGRILVISACVAQMTYTARAEGGKDLTFDLWPTTICTQIVQCVSLTTACIPYLQPFLLSLESGFLWGDDFRRQSTKDSSYTSGRPSKSRSTGQPLSSRSQSTPENSQQPDADAEDGRTHQPAIAMLPIPTGGEPLQTPMGTSWDSKSTSSQAGLTGFMAPASTAVDTRRRELEGY